ncbi:unnamed protein product [Onchocerca ochengi]|uniref:MBOAT_2 domain-containing protein n=1 Tax=Onchocerca ochengi TaxID=42157 RepID=A0A182EFB5_ONCOC|nr:unnamed protein product [Onchocerca ochengi]
MQLECACTFIVTCESTRISMKIHSFIREVYSLAVRLKIKAGKTNDLKMILPRFEKGNLTTLQLPAIISDIFVSIIAGASCLLLLFYGLLHCWLNMMAEILRYSDRQFYLVLSTLQNWWNSKSMAEYYRFWNLVVYDWLYFYIYKDISQLAGGKKGRFAAQTMVFFLSSFFHEYWFGLALRMFYPVIFTLYFIFGGIFYFISQFITCKRTWNIVMYTNLLIGTGMFVSLYSQEWYARQQCAPYFKNSMLDFFLPRHWFCRELNDTWFKNK